MVRPIAIILKKKLRKINYAQNIVHQNKLYDGDMVYCITTILRD